MLIRQLGTIDYPRSLQAMRDFTEVRDQSNTDELWLLEHPGVFTQGLAGKSEHLLSSKDIPVIQTERGGQITYHGPGQLICYVLLDLKRRRLGIKKLVNLLEQAIIDLLADQSIKAQRHDKAPGVYVDQAKIAALGLRVRKGCSYHGLALNIDMDLQPFTQINPCGYPDLEITQMRDQMSKHFDQQARDQIGRQLVTHLCRLLKENQQACQWQNKLPQISSLDSGKQVYEN